MFRDAHGKLSFMRIGSFIALCLGFSIGIIGGIGFLNQFTDSVSVIAVSQAMIALVLGAKAWQKTSEQ